jgi:hypothetical protein
VETLGDADALTCCPPAELSAERFARGRGSSQDVAMNGDHEVATLRCCAASLQEKHNTATPFNIDCKPVTTDTIKQLRNVTSSCTETVFP